ncbi:hypothetical protein [Caballeronia arationis]|uniref:hypothetical protein n=1 Tax=Caballeronia arationis TaxID=1777142 RepID=UPI001F196ABC|nr:hypothetical protein [Caballeronia arationis]
MGIAAENYFVASTNNRSFAEDDPLQKRSEGRFRCRRPSRTRCARDRRKRTLFGLRSNRRAAWGAPSSVAINLPEHVRRKGALVQPRRFDTYDQLAREEGNDVDHDQQ